MKTVLCALALLIAGLQPVAAETVFEVALPTAKEHIGNRVLQRWVDLVALRSGKRLAIRLLHSATRYEGAQIATAVAEGAFDMAVPGWWHLSQIVPEYRISALPMFYGRGRDDGVAVFDGPLGRELDASLEAGLNVQVLGRRIELGIGHVYLARKVEKYADFSDLNIRVPGGTGDLARFLAFGATPRRVDLVKVKDTLRERLIDGLLTTHTYVRDEALWKTGVKFAFLDSELFYQYTPIVNRARWNALSDGERATLTQSWEETVEDMRAAAMREQAAARDAGAQNGIDFATPPESEIRSMRERLMQEQPALVQSLGMNADFVNRVQAALEARDNRRESR
jgi:TRAP-type C4-dicarboxylate transport system substrate-binding protein